jgi:predicted enzyme related to lactoylglutathione lyase
MAGIAAFHFVTIDARDPEALARFWAEVLGTSLGTSLDEGRFLFLQRAEGIPLICFQRVPEAKSGKNRIHLDLGVDDLDEATAAIEALGGTRVGARDLQLDGAVWRTMADPEGNEFDITVG